MNRHAVALVLDERGIVIVGPSGAGKTTLALALIDHVTARRGFARLVADDQVLLSSSGERVIAAAPSPIAGLAEAHGAGPTPIPHLERAIVDLAVELVVPNEAPRLEERRLEILPGRFLPSLALPRRNVTGGMFAILARLRLPPFC